MASGPRSKAARTTGAEWNLAVSSATSLLSADFDGNSQHVAARAGRKALDVAKLPEGFELGVMFGPSGSGKSSVLQDVAEHCGQLLEHRSMPPNAAMICTVLEVAHATRGQIHQAGLDAAFTTISIIGYVRTAKRLVTAGVTREVTLCATKVYRRSGRLQWCADPSAPSDPGIRKPRLRPRT
jgi:hypothetical protein